MPCGDECHCQYPSPSKWPPRRVSHNPAAEYCIYNTLRYCERTVCCIRLFQTLDSFQSVTHRWQQFLHCTGRAHAGSYGFGCVFEKSPRYDQTGSRHPWEEPSSLEHGAVNSVNILVLLRVAHTGLGFGTLYFKLVEKLLYKYLFTTTRCVVLYKHFFLFFLQSGFCKRLLILQEKERLCGSLFCSFM